MRVCVTSVIIRSRQCRGYINGARCLRQTWLLAFAANVSLSVAPTAPWRNGCLANHACFSLQLFFFFFKNPKPNEWVNACIANCTCLRRRRKKNTTTYSMSIWNVRAVFVARLSWLPPLHAGPQNKKEQSGAARLTSVCAYLLFVEQCLKTNTSRRTVRLNALPNKLQQKAPLLQEVFPFLFWCLALLWLH